MNDESDVILSVQNLTVEYPVFEGGLFRQQTGTVKAVDDVSFDLERGSTLGIVGESGSGKTSLIRAILRAIDPSAGKVLFSGEEGVVDLARLQSRQLLPLRKQMQMIFQDPFASLNPRMKVGDIIEEPLQIHYPKESISHREKVRAILREVGLDADASQRFPHAFSGGQRQRIGIARALILGPRLVVCDEAVSALDVSVQAQVLNLLRRLQKQLNLTYIFVSHDLNVVHQFCETALVMYKGRVVETGKVAQLFNQPEHNYTKLLISAIPSIDPDIRLAPLSRAELGL